MKAFNLVSAVLAATVLATAAVQWAAPEGGGGASGWRIAAVWMLGAVVWAVVFSFVRDGVRATASVLTRRG